jgi:hypothetical protein
MNEQQRFRRDLIDRAGTRGLAAHCDHSDCRRTGRSGADDDRASERVADQDDARQLHLLQDVHTRKRVEDAGHEMARSPVVEAQRRPTLAGRACAKRVYMPPAGPPSPPPEPKTQRMADVGLEAW